MTLGVHNPDGRYGRSSFGSGCLQSHYEWHLPRDAMTPNTERCDGTGGAR